jgi:Cu-Zn family superoxide dismutase
MRWVDVRRRWSVAPAIVLMVGGTSIGCLATAASGDERAAPAAADPKVTPAAPALPAVAVPAGAGRLMRATARLTSPDEPGLSGTATFIQQADAVRVVVDLTGVSKPGPHGLHLHESGSCEPGAAGKRFATAGGHLNPSHVGHACPDSSSHHAGDFGNVEIKPDGTGHFEIVTALLSFDGPGSPLGRALILHAAADDCKTQPAGNSGERLACGVVEPAEPTPGPTR